MIQVKGIGWERAVSLWYSTFTHLDSRSTMRGAAQVMLARSLYYGVDAVIATGCAWHAVGVGDFRLSSFNTSLCSKLSASTPTVATPTCNGVAFGYVCQGKTAPNAAYACVNGSIAGGVLCNNPKQKCKRRSSTDWSASYDLVHGLACE